MNIFNANFISGSASGPFTGSITNVFSRGGTIVDDTNFITTNQVFTVWRSPYSCELLSLYCRASGDVGVQVNARKSGSAGYQLHTGSNLVIGNTNTWLSSNSVSNNTYNSGDTLEFIISGSANVNSVSIQADFRRI